MNISKETMKEHFNNSNNAPTGHGRFLKKIEITCMQRNGGNFLILGKFCIWKNKMVNNTFGSLLHCFSFTN